RPRVVDVDALPIVACRPGPVSAAYVVANHDLGPVRLPTCGGSNLRALRAVAAVDQKNDGAVTGAVSGPGVNERLEVPPVVVPEASSVAQRPAALVTHAVELSRVERAGRGLRSRTVLDDAEVVGGSVETGRVQPEGFDVLPELRQPGRVHVEPRIDLELDEALTEEGDAGRCVAADAAVVPLRAHVPGERSAITKDRGRSHRVRIVRVRVTPRARLARRDGGVRCNGLKVIETDWSR